MSEKTQQEPGFQEMAARKLAHDLKNPLAGIAGVVEVLARELPAGSPGRELIPELRQEVRRIERLLEDFVEQARAAAPRKE